MSNPDFFTFERDLINRLEILAKCRDSGDTISKTAESQYCQGLIYGALLGGLITTDEFRKAGELTLDVTYPDTPHPISPSQIRGFIAAIFETRKND